MQLTPRPPSSKKWQQWRKSSRTNHYGWTQTTRIFERPLFGAKWDGQFGMRRLAKKEIERRPEYKGKIREKIPKEQPTHRHNAATSPEQQLSSKSAARHRVLDKPNKPTNGAMPEPAKIPAQKPHDHRKFHRTNCQNRGTIPHGADTITTPETFL